LGIAGGAAAVGVIAATAGGEELQSQLPPQLAIFMWVGNRSTFVLSVKNVGHNATNGTVTVTDTFPPELKPIQPTASEAPGWECSVNSQTLTCTRSDALAGGSIYPHITVPVDVVGPEDLWTNTATASGGGANTASASYRPPRLTLTKSASSSSFTRGSTGSFTLTVFIDGFHCCDDFTLTDTFPAGLTPTPPPQAEGWECSINSQTLTCIDVRTFVGETLGPITVSANVAPTAAESLTNTATVSGGLLQPATSSVTVSPHFSKDFE
jgi:uncharacterized repeat protein (TIGR01451 family)